MNNMTLGNNSLNLDFLRCEKRILSYRAIIRFQLEGACKAPTIITDISLLFNKWQ